MIRAVFLDYATFMTPSGEPHAGADAFVRACVERFPLVAMTSTSYATADKALKAAGLASFFLDILTVAEADHPKPAPDVLLATLGRIGFLLRDRNPIEPRECLVVESSIDGIEAAKRAGMRSLAIGTQAAKADFVRDSFAAIDLDEILRALK